MTNTSSNIRIAAAALALSAAAQATAAGTYVYVRKVPGLQGPALPWAGTSSPGSGNTGNPPEQPTETGTPATLSLTTSSLGFRHVPVQSQSTLTVDAVNSGTKPLNISSAAVSGADFTSTSNCVGPLAGGAACRVTVVFAPSSRGTANGTLVVQSSAGSQSASLLGSAYTGTLQMPSYAFPTPLEVGSPVVWQDLSVFNPSSAPVTITGASVVTGADSFSQENRCAGSLAPGSSCTVRVGFTPSTEGHREGVVALTSDSEDSPHLLTLAGEGSPPPAILVIASGQDTYAAGDVAVGTTLATGIVTIRNGGPTSAATLTVSGSGDYSLPPATGLWCRTGLVLQVAGTCRMRLVANVTEERTYSGTATVSAGNSAVTISATARGVPPPTFAVSEASYTFPLTQGGGYTTPVHRFTATHTGGPTLTLNTSLPSDTGFVIDSNTCGMAMTAGQSCYVDVKWKSLKYLDEGTATATLILSPSAGQPVNVSLAAPYDTPRAVVSLPDFNSPKTKLGSYNVYYVQVTNPSKFPAYWQAQIDSPTAEFRVNANDCTSSLPAGGTCTLPIIYEPSSLNPVTATLLVLISNWTTYTLSATPVP